MTGLDLLPGDVIFVDDSFPLYLSSVDATLDDGSDTFAEPNSAITVIARFDKFMLVLKQDGNVAFDLPSNWHSSSHRESYFSRLKLIR